MKAEDAPGTPVPAPRTTTAIASSPAFRLHIIGALVGALATAAALASASAAADVRTLDLYNVHTRERLTITFKRNGRYIPSALAELNRFLRDWRRNESIKMDPRLFDTVWELYQKAGSHQPLHVVCGYRSLATNNMLRSRSSAVAQHSQHTLGRAMDLNMPDVSVDKLRAIGMKMQNGGVGWYPSANSPFVHIDVGNVRSWPRMPRTQLVQLFPDGKTAHIPADGKPMPGYQQALADIQRKKGVPIAIDGDTAVASAATKRGGGLLAMLFGGGEEDSSTEIEAAADDEAPAAPAKSAPVVVARPAVPDRIDPAIAAKPAAEPIPEIAAKPAAPERPAPAIAPVQPAVPVLLASAPRPQPAPRPAAITSLAEATLPADAAAAPFVKVDAEKADADTAVAAPLPLARPDDLVPAPVVLAALDVPAVLPPLKPAAPGRDDALAAQAALAEVAGGARPDGAVTALSYAAETLPQPAPARSAARGQPAVQTAALTAAPTARPAMTGVAGGPASLTRLADPKGDMLGGIEASLVASEDGPSLLDGSQSVYWGHFTGLTHPDQRNLSQLFEAPVTVSKATFTRMPYPGMVSTRFAGPVTPPNNVVRFLANNQLAMR